MSLPAFGRRTPKHAAGRGRPQKGFTGIGRELMAVFEIMPPPRIAKSAPF
jgi:hypothetical protein